MESKDLKRRLSSDVMVASFSVPPSSFGGTGDEASTKVAKSLINVVALILL